MFSQHHHKHLHSTIFILKLTFAYYNRFIRVFTFYYIYIKTGYKSLTFPHPVSFTFYYIYIKTLEII